jgi:hypothetical protein
MRAKRLMTAAARQLAAAPASLPTFETQLERLADTERSDGWLVSCDEAGCYLAINQEMVAAVASFLRGLRDKGPRLEVCAGNGELAWALCRRGVNLTATDVQPTGPSVLRASAHAALRRYRPTVVLGSFVPVDARVDEQVLACPSVRNYLVLNACIGDECGSAALWRTVGWSGRRVPQISRWMLTRHDVWTGPERQSVIRHGEAWCFSRTANRV